MSTEPAPHARWSRRSVLALTAATAGGLLVPSPAKALTGPIGDLSRATAPGGAKVVKETVVGPRTVDLTISTRSVGTVNVRLLLPQRWASAPATTWPTLYLLHGVGDAKGYRAWTSYTDVEAFTRDKDVLVVMPEAGSLASYQDEVRAKLLWERFHTYELPTILRGAYRANGANAVAGISSGGYGALVYTARHPGLFRATATYSGVTDTTDPAVKALVGSAASAGLDPHRTNPMDYAHHFRTQPLYLACGMGAIGPLDNAPGYKDQSGGRLMEAMIAPMNLRFAQKVQRYGGTPFVHVYAEGLHYWTYWQREFKLSWPLLAKALGAPTPGR